MSRSRSYCFTINNYDAADEAAVKSLASCSRYLVCGRERGESGTPHLQGYVYFDSARSFNAVKKSLSKAHIEVARGTAESNRAYCTKQEDFDEYGVIPSQGQRTDIDVVRDELRAGANMKAITNIAKSSQSIRVAETWLKYNEEPRTWKPEVRWYHGPTGAGKTRAAREWLGDHTYTCLNNGKYWEGYDAHESVLLDDFRKDFCKFHELLKILDRYEYRVEVKGASRQLLARKIAITAPFPPEEIYNTREDVKQLTRRIDEIISVTM